MMISLVNSLGGRHFKNHSAMYHEFLGSLRLCQYQCLQHLRLDFVVQFLEYFQYSDLNCRQTIENNLGVGSGPNERFIQVRKHSTVKKGEDVRRIQEHNYIKNYIINVGVAQYTTISDLDRTIEHDELALKHHELSIKQQTLYIQIKVCCYNFGFFFEKRLLLKSLVTYKKPTKYKGKKKPLLLLTYLHRLNPNLLTLCMTIFF